MKATVLLCCVAGLVCALLVGVSTTVAQPLSPRPSPPTSPTSPTSRDRGVSLQVAFGPNGCTDTWCENVDVFVGFRVIGLYRAFRNLSVGVHFSMDFGDPEDDFFGIVGGESEIQAYWNLFVGGELRGHVPIKRFELWGAIALGFGRYQVKARFEELIMGIPSTGHVRWRSDSFAIGWGAGFDYFVTRFLAIGAGFYLYKPFAREVCTRLEQERAGITTIGTSCGSLTDDQQDDIGIIWTVNAAATFFLGF